MKWLLVSIAGVALVTAGAAQAQGDQLLKKYNCMACHAIDKKLVGPAYADVAAKYKGDAKAPAMLVEKVKRGGAGNWGAIPMPPNAAAPEADLKTMVTYVLSLKK